jgi:molybdopterin converting factor small subunit
VNEGESFPGTQVAMRITIMFAGVFKALSQVERDTMEVVEGTTIDQLCRILGKKYKGLPFESEQTYFVVNDKVSKRDRALQENDEVRIFQMIPGG